MHPANHRARQRRPEAGFTLVELMVIVVIVGVLAMLGTYSVRKYITSSKTSEATGMISTIRAAEEAYKDETFTYLNVSGTLDNYYPANPTPGRAKAQWGAGDATLNKNFQILGVSAPQPVLFVYSVVAGISGTTPPAPGGAASDIVIGNWPGVQAAPWFVVKAMADLEGDGQHTVFEGVSFTQNGVYVGEVYSNGVNL
ncbi:MAG: prepilin-type N-terminal cleavage/methylation domain-containing protein [Polyangiaceae bacterium]